MFPAAPLSLCTQEAKLREEMEAVLVSLEEAMVCQEGALPQRQSENFLPALGHGAAGMDSSSGRRFQTAEVMFIVHTP